MFDTLLTGPDLSGDVLTRFSALLPADTRRQTRDVNEKSHSSLALSGSLKNCALVLTLF